MIIDIKDGFSLSLFLFIYICFESEDFNIEDLIFKLDIDLVGARYGVEFEIFDVLIESRDFFSV